MVESSSANMMSKPVTGIALCLTSSFLHSVLNQSCDGHQHGRNKQIQVEGKLQITPFIDDNFTSGADNNDNAEPSLLMLPNTDFSSLNLPIPTSTHPNCTCTNTNTNLNHLIPMFMTLFSVTIFLFSYDDHL